MYNKKANRRLREKIINYPFSVGLRPFKIFSKWKKKVDDPVSLEFAIFTLLLKIRYLLPQIIWSALSKNGN